MKAIAMMQKHVNDAGEWGNFESAPCTGAGTEVPHACAPRNNESMARTKLIGTVLDAILADMPRAGVRGF